MAESPRDELARRVAEYPPEALSFFKEGLTVASALSEESRASVLKRVTASFRSGMRRLSAGMLRSIAKLSERDAEQLAYTYSVMIGLLLESAATPDDFIGSAKGFLFDSDQEAVARSIATSICTSRGEIQATVDRAQLAGEVLPSLFTFDLAVDVRLRIVDKELKTFVPVAILHLDTDVENQETWVQLSKGEVEEAIQKLTECLENLNLAETLIVRKS
jgi:hypothetical protein